jgi:predicted transposase YbfD/YdcC
MPARNPLQEFASHFENLTDPRMARTRRHALLDIIVIALCALIANANSWVDVERYGKTKLAFLRRFLELPNGIPSHDTFSRVFARLDPAALLVCLQDWLRDFRDRFRAGGGGLPGEPVAIDGKTARGSHDGDTRPNALHLVSAWASDARLFLGQVAVDQKSNEITAIPQLLELLDIKDDTVTIDAMGCQKEIAQAILDKEADYVLQVKDNQPTLHQALSDAFVRFAEEDYTEPSLRRFRTVDRDHGRVETRDYFIADVPSDLPGVDLWPGLKSIGMVMRTRQEGDHTADEVAFYISSLDAQVKAFARAVRGHWSIENTLHWSLDVTFSEDHSRVRKDRGPENLAMLRRLVVSLLQQDTSCKASLRGKRLIAGWDDEALLKILTAFSEE